MRVAVVSNCQAFGLANSIENVGVGVSCDAFTLPELQQDRTIKERLKRDYEHVFAITSVAPGLEGLLPPERISLVPIVTFWGFHPDIVYLKSGSTNVTGPLGDYHSLIAFAAFRSGLSEEEALRLYDARFFAQAGYLDVWSASREILFGRFDETGLPLVDRFYGWVRRGVFMHTHNHPKIWVLADVARAALGSIGAEWSRVAADLPDNLAKAVVISPYPGIADRLGLPGAFRFKPSRETHHWELDELVHRSYQAYRSIPPDTIVLEHLQEREQRVLATIGEWR